MQGVRGSSPRSSTRNVEPPTLTPRRRRGVNRLRRPTRGPLRDRHRRHRTEDRRHRRVRRRPDTGRTLRPDRHRAALAGALGGARPVRDRSRGHEPAQVLHADDVPVPVGRPAHRALVHRDADRRAGALPADARLQRLLPDRLRCLRATGRERGDQGGRPSVHLDDAEHREHAPAVPDDGRDLLLEARGGHRRPVVLPLEPVDVPALPGAGPGLPEDVAGRLVPQRRDAGTRTGRGRGSALLALRRSRREARPRAVVPAHDRLRGRAAGLHRHRLAGAHPHPADELDRPLRGRGDRLRDGPVRPSAGRRDAARLHDAARHAVRGHVHGPGAGASARRRP